MEKTMFEDDRIYTVTGEDLNSLYAYFTHACQLASTEKRDLENRLNYFLRLVWEDNK